MKYPGFIGGSYEAAAITADQERTVNMYVERLDSQGASTKLALYLVPGLEGLGSASAAGGTVTGVGRAHYFEGGREWAVFGAYFGEIDSAGAFNPNSTTLEVDGNPATICSNGDGGGQLLITSGGSAYYFTLATGVLTRITALNGIATMGDYLDGYGIVLNANTSTFYISALLDFSSWTTGIDFAQRSQAPDPWKAMKVYGKYIALLGEHTSEFWYNSGAASFPFAPYPGALIPYGINAPFSAALGEGAMYWLGQSKVGEMYVLRATGFTPEIVSDFARRQAFSQYAYTKDAVGEVINWKGHVLYRLTFPAQHASWFYDATTNIWGEWLTWLGEQGRYEEHHARWHAMAFGEHRMLDANTDSIYRLSDTTFTDVDDRPIRWMRRAPALTAENERVYYAHFELDFEEGEGTVGGQGADPQVCMRMSDDGGRTWGNELWRSAGKIGEFTRRARWNRLGAARRRVFEVTGSDPIAWKITNAYLGLGQSVKASAQARR